MVRIRPMAALCVAALATLAAVVPVTGAAQAASLPPGGTTSPLHPIVPGAGWTDQNGRLVQAHGAGITKVGPDYYMYGEDKQNGGSFFAVSCYRSRDLVDWTYVGSPLTLQASGDLGPGRVVERPKVVYNDTTHQYVMWMHIDSADYQEAKVGVATSSTPCGPYQYQGSFRPLGFVSRDMNLFKDDDGTAYLLSEDRIHGLRVDRLSADYLSVVSNVATLSDYEAPAMAKVDGRYFLLGSNQSGWDTNDNVYTSATSLAGPWNPWTTFAPPGTHTFNSQTSTIVPVTGAHGTTYVFVGDRWQSRDLFDSPPVWLPLTISGSTVSLSWYGAWALDANTGDWAPQNADDTYEAAAAGNTLTGTAVRGGCSGCPFGTDVGWLGHGAALTVNNVTTRVGGTYTLKIGYRNGDGSDRFATVSVDGGAPVTVAFPPTFNDATRVSTISVPMSAGTHTVEIANPTGWAPDINRIALPDGPSTSVTLAGAANPASPNVNLAKQGQAYPVRATFTDGGPGTVDGATTSVTVPAGWTLTAVGTAPSGTVQPGQSVTSQWAITPPVGTKPGLYQIGATTSYLWKNGWTASTASSLTVTVPPPVPTGSPYVSDLSPLSWSVGWAILQIDKSPQGNPITIQGVTHAKGLGAHAKSSVLLYTGGNCTSFHSVVGVDDETGGLGSVDFHVFADGKEVASTGVIRAGDPGGSLMADVTGATEVELRVGDGGDGIAYDHSDWADAQLTCS